MSLSTVASLLIAVLWLTATSAGGAKYSYMDYNQMVHQLHQLSEKFPNYVTVDSAQSKYGLLPYGDCGKAGKCEVWFATITHRASLPGPGELDWRPEVFFSGALHGNERVGPVTTVEGARLLATAADCVDKSLARAAAVGGRAAVGALLSGASGPELCAGALGEGDEAMLAADARGDPAAEAGGLRWRGRRRRLLWLHRLARTRRVVVMPAANAQGFHLNRREEGRIDPNRDFPFVQDKHKCFQTVAARAMNEVAPQPINPAPSRGLFVAVPLPPPPSHVSQVYAYPPLPLHRCSGSISSRRPSPSMAACRPLPTSGGARFTPRRATTT